MAEVDFRARYVLPPMSNPDVDALRGLILEPFRPGREFGEATITFRDGDREATLILIADRELGFYLNYEPTGDTWLSLGDPARLTEVVCPDDWQVSVGLFLPPEAAWAAVSEFCPSGSRSAKIRWVRPADMPEGANW